MKVICAHCGKIGDKRPADVNRARRNGMRLFCGRRCFGLDRRKHKPRAQRVAEKRLYDQEYRNKNRAALKRKKQAYFKRTYDPAIARIKRKKRAKAHAEYCRRPEYKAWKSEYDRNLRASKFGQFAPAYLLSLDLGREIKQRISNYDKATQNESLNKVQARRRASAQGEREPSGRRDHPAAYR